MKGKSDFNKEPAFGGKEAPVKQTTRDKVEAWLKDMPKEIILYGGVDVEEIINNERVTGQVTPIIIKGGYEITMSFRSMSWEEDDE